MLPTPRQPRQQCYNAWLQLGLRRREPKVMRTDPQNALAALEAMLRRPEPMLFQGVQGLTGVSEAAVAVNDRNQKGDVYVAGTAAPHIAPTQQQLTWITAVCNRVGVNHWPAGIFVVDSTFQ